MARGTYMATMPKAESMVIYPPQTHGVLAVALSPSSQGMPSKPEVFPTAFADSRVYPNNYSLSLKLELLGNTVKTQETYNFQLVGIS
eukprot:2782292-Amphidinium_carterae.1